MDEQKSPGLTISQVFLLEAHFAHREDALSIPATTRAPDQTINVEIQVMKFQERESAGIVVRAFTDPEDKEGLYRYSVAMMALIEKEEGKENLAPIDFVTANGTTFLFPFLREAIANLTMRGRFGPIWVKPFNVRAVVEKHAAAMEARLAAGQ